MCKRFLIGVRSWLRKAHRCMDEAFYRLGCSVTDHAVLVLFLSLVVAVALSTGLLRVKAEDRYDKLWSTPGSSVDSANAAFAKYFEASSQPAQVIVTSANTGDNRNVLAADVLLETLNLHETILLELKDGLRKSCQPLENFLTKFKGQRSRVDVLRNQSLDVSECTNINGVLSAFHYSRDDIRNFGKGDGGDVSRRILGHFSPASSPRQPAALYLGNVAIPAAMNTKSSPAFRLVYSIDTDYSGDFQLDKKFVDTVHAFSSSSKVISAQALGPASLDRETERSLSSDFWLVGISASILIVFSVLNAGNIICLDPVHSKTVVALCGMASVGLAVGASIGFVTYCGVMFSAIQIAMICVILAIGVDDMFVICDALARQDRRLPLRERIGGALAQVGTSIAMTSATDAVTFALVAINAVPGVESFAINATVAVVFDFILQVTFFAACLALDEKRADSRHVDLLCCFSVSGQENESVISSSDGSTSSSPTLHSSIKKADSLSSSATLQPRDKSHQLFLSTTCLSMPQGKGNAPLPLGMTSPGPSHRQPGEKYITYLFRVKYAPFVIRSGWLKVVTVIVAIGLCGVSSYGVTLLSSELQLSDTLVDDSFVLEYQQLEKTYFSSVSLQVELVVTHGTTPLSVAQRQIRSLGSSIEKSASFHPYVASWFDHLCLFAESCNVSLVQDGLVPDEDFSWLIRRFLNSTAGQHFRSDIVLRESNDAGPGDIVMASRLLAWQHASPKTNVLLTRMTEAQRIASTDSTDGMTAHAYSYLFRFLHQVENVRSTGYHTVVMSLAVVMVITWFFFEGSVTGAVVCTLLIGVVNFNMFGFMTYVDLEYNHASHTVLVIGIGFSVDYIAHVVLAFAKAKGEPDERVRIALMQMGASVFSGSLTTFLGVIALVFGSVEISRIFAKLVCLLISLSAFYGLVLSPILLLYIGRRWSCITEDLGKSNPNSALPTPVFDNGLPSLSHKLRANGLSGVDFQHSMPCLHIEACPPSTQASEESSKTAPPDNLALAVVAAPELSASMTALSNQNTNNHYIHLQQSMLKPKTKSTSMQSLSLRRHNSSLQAREFPPLYKAVRVSSDGGVPRVTSSPTVPLPHHSSVRCESSL